MMMFVCVLCPCAQIAAHVFSADAFESRVHNILHGHRFTERAIERSMMHLASPAAAHSVALASRSTVSLSGSSSLVVVRINEAALARHVFSVLLPLCVPRSVDASHVLGKRRGALALPANVAELVRKVRRDDFADCVAAPVALPSEVEKAATSLTQASVDANRARTHFHSECTPSVIRHCPFLTLAECRRHGDGRACDLVHFRPFRFAVRQVK